MLDGVQMPHKGAQDFEACYDHACAMQDSVPLPAVRANLSQGMLALNGDRLKPADWTPILKCLAINKHLHHVALSSSYQSGLGIGEHERYRLAYRKKIPAIQSKEMTLRLCKALQECLTTSTNLKTLQLHGLPLRERDLITLTKGLAKNASLENLSFAHCPIADKGLEAVCQSVKYSSSIKTVDFTGCNLTWRGAEHMANIIRHQAMQRHSVAWAESLRYRKPEFEGMGGLRRVTLNCNTLVGDRGAAAIAKELTEDFWVKAVDLQKCGLSNKGTHALLEAVKFNTTVCVLDIRGNPLVDKDLVKTVIERVLVNGQSSKYSWIKPPSLKENPQKPPGLKRKTLGNTAKGKATFRMGPRRLCSSSRPSPDEVQPPHPSSSRCIPWRTAERAGRQRGISLENTVDKQSFEGGASVRVTLETESEEEDEDGADSKSLPAPSFQDSISVRQYKRLQVELEECRLRLAEERRARVKTDRRLMEYELENARLRSINFSLSEALQVQTTGSSSVLEEDAVLDSIESSFRKFHAFLDLLKDAGLGQLASIAGIDHSDFGPVGRPQLSSTVGQPPAGTGTETVAGDQDTGEKVDPALAGCEDPSAPSEGHPNGFPPGGPATLTGLLPEGDPREVPRIAANDQASKTCVEETGGENQQRDASLSKPEGRQAKDSYSGHSQGSFANVSQRGSVSHHRNGDGVMPSNFSDRGNGSHGYSFKYCNDSPANSSILTDDSYSNDWHGDSSVMSSLSERGISVGSFGSKASGGGMAKS